MTQTQRNIIISFFKAWYSEESITRHDIHRVNGKAVKLGYVVHPAICDRFVEEWIDQQDFNPNSTFYRRWKNVTEKTRLELLLDQLIHYASTYGTDYSAETYCPNGDPIKIDYKQYTVIESVTEEELLKRIYDVLVSGIALKSNIVEAFCTYLLEHSAEEYDWFDIDSIANREALVILCTKLKLYPHNPEGLVRLIFYICTGESMLIQDKMSLARLQFGASRFDLGALSREHLMLLAQVFNRYKKVFMALKGDPVGKSCGFNRPTADEAFVLRSNKKAVNRISRLSKKYHKPFRPGYWENITNIQRIDWDVLDRKVAELTNPFKIVKLLEMIKLRKVLAHDKTPRAFIIRNGKLWIDSDSLAPYPTDFERIADKLIMRLVQLIKVEPVDKHKPTIALPAACELMCPASEKKFVGDLPFGSYYTMKESNNYIGVYWRNEWGTHDFDLSFIKPDGTKIGWNASYYDRDYNEGQNVLYSGDMTNADPEATEVILMKNEIPEGTVYINRYNGDNGSKYKLFFGQDKCDGFKKNYMVDPNSIVLEDMMVSDKAEQIIGQVFDGKIYFLSLSLSDRHVSRRLPEKAERARIDGLKALCVSHIPLKPILEAAGYQIIDDPKKADIDLSKPSKEKLLKIFTPQ